MVLSFLLLLSGMTVVCPASIDTSQGTTPPAGWRVSAPPRTASFLEGISFGGSGTLQAFTPGETRETKASVIDTYYFGDGSVDISVYCSYQGTNLQLTRAIGKPKSCSVTLFKQRQNFTVACRY